MNKRQSMVAFFVVLLAALTLVPHAHAAPRQRCFNETGFCVSGVILDYWEKNGGLPVFGYPVGPQQVETVEGAWTGPVQWFERDRLEDHSAQNQGVLAGRLGARWLELTSRPWIQGNEAPGKPGGECLYFGQTGYNICNQYFRRYWEQNGGLERFGYPITGVFDEQIEGKTYTVQYFERRRLEYHPENAGTNYQVLLGLLGRSVYQQSGGACTLPLSSSIANFVSQYRDRMGCPTSSRDVQTAFQQFENGQMIWVQGNATTPPTIYVNTINPQTGAITWSKYTDTYVEGEAVGGSETPPAARVAPARGFGKIWWNTPAIRRALGWAMAPEQPGSGTLVEYSLHEGRMLFRPSFRTADIFLPSGEYNGSSFGTR